MRGRMRALILCCAALLAVGGAAVLAHGPSATQARAPARAIRFAAVDRAVARRRSGSRAGGGSGACFIQEGFTSRQTCGRVACTEFVDATVAPPGTVADGSRCADVPTRAIVVRGRSRPVVTEAPRRGSMRSRLRAFVRHLPR